MNEHAALRRKFLALLRNHGQRQFIAISGDSAWQRQFVNQWLTDIESEASVLTNLKDTPFTYISDNKIPLLLGKECQHFIFDANQDFDPNHLGIIGGMLTAGGLLFFLLPETRNWNNSDALYFRYFLNILQDDNRCIFISQSEISSGYSQLEKRTSQLESLSVTSWPDYGEQYQAIEALKKVIHSGRRTPTILFADRGRGKSAALGIAASELLEKDISHVIITSQSKQSAGNVFKHIKNTYQDKNATKKAIYLPIDELIKTPKKTDLVLVDEAATIPLPQLYKLIKIYPRIAFASTVHGYEGSGRGFNLHFTHILEQHCRNWRRINLTSPIRWYKDDPLEGFLYRALMLDAEVDNVTEYLDSKRRNLLYKKLTSEDLYQDEHMLRQLFGLFSLAHYRTKPRDLKIFLNQQGLNFYCAINPENDSFIGACLCQDEGDLDTKTARLVMHGKHRPKGHVLPQTLSMQAGYHSTLSMQCSRIVRIVVHPQWQRHGIGSTLLQFSIKQMPEKQIIGSSFSMQHEVLQFWYKNQFEPVRIGSKARVASAMQHVIYLYQKTEKATQISESLQRDIQLQWPYLCSTVLKQTPPILLADILKQLTPPPQADSSLLISWFAFAYLNRPAESVALQLQQAVLYLAANHHLIEDKTLEKSIYYLSQQNLWHNGQRSKQATEFIKTIIKELLKKTEPEFTFARLRKLALSKK